MQTLLVIATPEIFRPVSSVANPGMKKSSRTPERREHHAMLNNAHQGSRRSRTRSFCLHRLGLKILIDRASKMRNKRSLRARKTIENLSRKAPLIPLHSKLWAVIAEQLRPLPSRFVLLRIDFPTPPRPPWCTNLSVTAEQSITAGRVGAWRLASGSMCPSIDS